MQRIFSVVIACGLAIGSSTSAKGNVSGFFEGREVRVERHALTFGHVVQSANAVVTDGVEFPQTTIGPFVVVDFSDTTVRFNWIRNSSFTPGEFNGYRIHDFTGTIPDFGNILIDPVSNIVGMSESRIAFDNDSIRVNMQGLPFTAQSILQIHVVPIPEPATGQMAIVTLVLFAVPYRGRRVAAVPCIRPAPRI
jgi:hypothetical protein